ncbi:MAG: hypothetical protein M9913_17785 [Bryobacteraceae bacterium]|nr:hypothetical protein [Solibacteraceae bacterium]MCL4843305.1 hypothetical protein [Bryobacteraceae bacterium]MCO5352718.1 hypothetical protein [Bryobacteraceae bacterium]
MTLLRLFETSPFAGLTLLLCSLSLLLAIHMVRQARWREDRFIAGFVGLLAMHQAFAVLKDAGVVPQNWKSAEELAGAVIAALFLAALIVFRIHLWQMHNARMRLRISEMNMAPQTWSPDEVEALEFITRGTAPAKPGTAKAAAAGSEAPGTAQIADSTGS